MKSLTKRLFLAGFLVFTGGSTLATATEIDLTTVGFGPVTYFDGTQQESTITFDGCQSPSFGCEIPVNLTPGASLLVRTHSSDWDLGVNDGVFPGPDETVTVETVFSVGGNSVSIFQEARLRQIANNQFQFNLSESETQVLDLGAVGLLHITGMEFAGQAPSGFGGGSLFRSTLLLVPEPSSAMILYLGLLAPLTQRRASFARTASH